MKRRRLKPWVRKALFIIGLLLFLMYQFYKAYEIRTDPIERAKFEESVMEHK